MDSSFGYAAVVAEEPQAVAAALARGFGLAPVALPGATAVVLALGNGAIVLAAPGDPLVGGATTPGPHHVGLAAADPRQAAERAAAAGIAAADLDGEPGLAGRRRVWLPADGTLGLRTCFTEPLGLDPDPAAAARRIDHIGVASRDNAAAIALFSGCLGFPVESTQTDVEIRTSVESFTSDKYGVVHHARPPEIVGGLRVAFIDVGGTELEFLEDLDPGREAAVARHAPGTTRQDKGAIARFIARRGPGLHHLALRVDDADRALGALAAAGLEIIDPVGRPGSRRARIGFVHPRSLGGLLLHVVARDDGGASAA